MIMVTEAMLLAERFVRIRFYPPGCVVDDDFHLLYDAGIDMYGRGVDDILELWVPVSQRDRALKILPTPDFVYEPCPTCDKQLKVDGAWSGFFVLAGAALGGWMILQGHTGTGAGILMGAMTTAQSLQQRPPGWRCSSCGAFFTSAQLLEIKDALSRIDDLRPFIEFTTSAFRSDRDRG